MSIQDDSGGDDSEEVVTKEETIVENIPSPPRPAAVEKIQVEKVDVTGPDLVKLTRRIEDALNAVIAKVVQRKKEIASELRKFEVGIMNILRLLGSVQPRSRREAKKRREAAPSPDDDVDDDAGDDDDDNDDDEDDDDDDDDDDNDDEDKR